MLYLVNLLVSIPPFSVSLQLSYLNPTLALDPHSETSGFPSDIVEDYSIIMSYQIV